MSQLDLASKKLASFFNSCLHLFTGTPPPFLYHYTSEANLDAILRSGRFWASNIAHQNDAAELRYAASVFRAHLERAYAQDYYDDACALFAAMRPYVDTSGPSKVHTVSLVTDNDSEQLWRLYGDRGIGCALAFPTGSVANWGEGWYLLRCCYSDDELNNFCRYALSFIRAIFLEDRIENPNAGAEDYASLFVRSISWFAPMFKAKVWSDEQEWRLVRVIDNAEAKRRPDGRSYIEAPSPNAGRLEIGAVCLGPNNKSLEATNRVHDALTQAGYGSVTVHHSALQHFYSIPSRRGPA